MHVCHVCLRQSVWVVLLMSKGLLKCLKLSGFIIVCWILSQVCLAKILLLINSYCLLQRRRKTLNHLLYDPNKEILGQKQGINLFLDAGSDLKHIHNCTAGCSPLNILSSLLLPCLATVCVATLMSLSHSTACGLPLWMPPPTPPLSPLNY